MSLDPEVVVTRSGARAMRDRLTGEVMHPVVGPLVEADRLYLSPSRLKSRLSAPGSEPLVLLDVGLGAGSNAALAFQVSESRTGSTRALSIESFDRSTAALEVALEPQHAAAFGLVGAVETAARDLVRVGSHVTPRTRWQLRRGDARATLDQVADGTADVVFWDPFSPRKNPELWSLAVFRSVRRVCRPGATLHTYSGSTAVRSALLLAGFCVGVGVAIGPGKSSTIAALTTEALENPLDQRWLERLGRSSSAFPADAPADAWQRVRDLGCFQIK